MPSTPRLAGLPSEIIFQIALYLDAAALKALRLSCKHVEASVFHRFALEYFAEIQVMRARPSLLALIDISKSRFSPYVKRLVVSTEVLHDFVDRLADRSRDSRGQLSHAYHWFHRQAAAQLDLMSSGQDRKMLAEALSNLTLDTAGMRDCHVWDERGCTSWRRPRKLRSLLSTYIYTFVGLGLREMVFWPTRRDEHKESCFQTLLVALGAAKALPRRLEVYYDNPEALLDRMLEIPPDEVESVVPVLSGLQDLSLELSAEGGERSAWNPDVDGTRHLRNFLRYTTGIRSLAINLRNMNESSQGFCAWLAAPPPPTHATLLRQEPAPIALPELRHLELSGLTVDVEVMIKVVTKFASNLKSLAINTTTFEDEPRTEPFEGFEGNTPCRKFIQALVPLSHQWTEIRLRKNSESLEWESIGVEQVVSFCINSTACDDQANQGAGWVRYATFSYRGPEVTDALEGLLLCMGSSNKSWCPKLEGELILADERGRFNALE